MEKQIKYLSQEQDDDIIDLGELFHDFVKGLKKFWWLLIVLPLLGAGVGFCYGMVNYVPNYTASATFSVKTSSTTSSSDVVSDYGYVYNSNTASQLSKTFPSLANSDIIRDEIKDDLDTDQINGSISALVVSDSNLVTVKADSSSKEDALVILQSFVKHFPDLAQYVLGSTEISMLKTPSVTDEPTNQDWCKNLAIKGFFTGLVLILLCCVIYAVTRNTIRQAEDFQQKLNRPCLGFLPHVVFNKNSGDIDRSVTIYNSRITGFFQESVRYMRTKLLEDLREHPEDKVILVTSTLPGEGKTTVASNIAITLARNGASVILVDADLRAPSVAATLNMEDTSCGLLDVLQEKVSLEDALCEYSSMRVLAGVSESEKAAAWLNTQKMKGILQSLKEQADYVIVDAAPCGLLSDAVTLGGFADCALYVVKQDCANLSQIIDGIEKLASSRVRISGCIFNDVHAGFSGYGYGYGAYGGYGKYGRYGKYGEYGNYGDVNTVDNH